MKKLEEMLREKTIKNKLSFVFRIMDGFICGAGTGVSCGIDTVKKLCGKRNCCDHSCISYCI